jgi:signal transduction histidine kinase
MSGKQLELRQSLVPSEVIGNQHRIEQVLVNFVTNAIRHSPEQATIRIATSEEAGMVQVRVENTGTHIEEEHLAKIWDRFYRGESSRSRVAGGTGLGLAICKKILELHGVPYGACNTADGVVFYFQLPTDRKGRLRLDGYPSD